MQQPVEKTPELMEAVGNAWSCSEKPPGKYIGSVTKGNKTYYYYKHGTEYFFETDFDREMREKERERRRSREQRMGKTSF